MATEPGDRGTRGVYLITDNSQEIPPPVPLATDPEPPRRRGKDAAPSLPDDCPVKPLGKYGTTCYYLDDIRQLVSMGPRDHGHSGIASLFGRNDHLLEEYWPRKKKTTDDDGNEIWITTGWKPDEGMRALMRACADKGIWNPFERIRGRGAWPAANGKLIYHAGDKIFDGAKWRDPGVIGNHVYPGGEAIAKPWPEPVDRHVAAEFLSLLKSWNWARKEIDPLLKMGWCGAALVCGALDWRPNAWTTGDKNTGKSTLHKLLRGFFGRGFIQVSDASEPAIRRKLDHDALPVAFDELESKEDNRRSQSIIGFARLSASGSVILRVGDDKTTNDFVARSCFLFSSINIPGLLSQDVSRMAILALGPLQGSKPPDIGEERMGQFGRQFLRRIMDGWARYGETLALYRAALQREGHSARGADVFGTLLAIADVLLHDGTADSDSVDALAQQLTPMTMAELSDDATDAESCLQHLLTTAIPKDGGGFNRRAVAHYIALAADDDDPEGGVDAARMLHTHGLRVFKDEDGQTKFAVANRHVELARLFAGTQWGGQPGALAPWVQSLRRLPMAEASKGNIRFGAVSGKATLMPIELVVTLEKKRAPRNLLTR